MNRVEQVQEFIRILKITETTDKIPPFRILPQPNDDWIVKKAERLEREVTEFSSNPLRPIREVLESIFCLCAEGPEFSDKLTICEVIQKEVQRGLKIVDDK